MSHHCPNTPRYIILVRIRRHSKEEILKLYASHTPYGGNVVGLETAAWRYFGIPAHELSWGQSAALAVLPNAPALIFPGRNEQAFLDKRNRLLKKLWKKEIIDETTYELAIAEPLPQKPFPFASGQAWKTGRKRPTASHDEENGYYGHFWCGPTIVWPA